MPGLSCRSAVDEGGYMATDESSSSGSGGWLMATPTLTSFILLVE
ncbi:hypothetical protein ACFLV4_05380 [Chloroflexota bacterium]